MACLALPRDRFLPRAPTGVVGVPRAARGLHRAFLHRKVTRRYTRSTVTSAVSDGGELHSSSSGGAGASDALEKEVLQRFFAEDELVKDLAAYAKTLKRQGAGGILVSDAITPDKDGGTLQWVDLVMAGGGMLGIAHVGAVLIFEEAGLRFLGLAGTSAGAINAAIIATVRNTLTDKSWPETVKILMDEKFSFAAFEDGDSYYKALRKALMGNNNGNWFDKLKKAGILLAAPLKIWSAVEAMGLHPGTAFWNWMHETMEKYKVTRQEDLDKKLQLDGIKILRRDPEQSTETTDFKNISKMAEIGDGLKPSLKLVTSEIGTQSLIVFPEDAELFYEKPKEAPPADYVRASMSVPGFFQPFVLPKPSTGSADQPKLPDAGTKKSDKWKKRVGFRGPVPDQAVFVDGGTLSNFPIFMFHNDDMRPVLPPIGVQLGFDRIKANKITNALALVRGMNDTSRHVLDREFLLTNPAYKPLVLKIDTSAFGWLDFDMTPEKQRQLLVQGMIHAILYLRKWQVATADGAGGKWEKYKDRVSPALERLAGVKAEMEEAGEEEIPIDDLMRAFPRTEDYQDAKDKEALRTLKKVVGYTDDQLRDALTRLTGHNFNNDAA